MTKRDVMTLALKIIGVIWIVDAARRFTGLPALILLWTTKGWPPSPHYRNYRIVDVFAGLAQPVLFLVIGYLLVVWSGRLAARLVSAEATLPELSTLTFGKKTFAFALRIVGTIVLLRGLSYATTAGAQAIWAMKPVGLPYHWSWPANAVLYCVIGVYLLTGAKHLVNFAYRNRQPDNGGH